MKAVDKHADLLRESASDVGNDHRLGANEAPPAIISMFLGEQLEDVVMQLIDKGDATSSIQKGKLKTGASTLPDLNKDATDRNRTSPFAFTGNKFEFRMVGSSDSIAPANVVLNTIVAESFKEIADELEGSEDMQMAVHDMIKKLFTDHHRVVFNGNGYSDEWVAEAERRGLPNIKSMVEAVGSLVKPETVKMFEGFGVFTEAELKSRAEIKYEAYSKAINIEAKTMIDMAGKEIIPAIISYTTELANSVLSVKEAGADASVQADILTEVSGYLKEMKAASAKLAEAVATAALPAMVQLNGTTTVKSSSYFGYGQSYEATSSGTGIIVGKSDTELLIVTNAHVVDNIDNLKCVFSDGTSASCSVKGSKSDQDIAVAAVSLSDISSDTASNIAIAELEDSSDIKVGQQVVAIGNALGEGQSVTTGIISAKDRSITVNNVTFTGLLMTDAAINSGNSGGALLNSEGKVIAINFAKTSSDGVEGMAYSIPVSNVKDIIDSLMTKQTRNKVSSDKAAYLGIAAVDITSNYASYYGYPVGILIRTVADDSAADKAGLETYDIIVGFDDQTVTTMSGLTNMLQYYEAGEKVTTDYYHMEGSEYVLKSTEVTLGSKKAS